MFLTGILDGLITANVNINRINLIFYPLIVFCGAGIVSTCRLAGKIAKSVSPHSGSRKSNRSGVKNKFPKTSHEVEASGTVEASGATVIPKIVAAAIIVLFLAGFIMFSVTYFTSYADTVSDTFMEDFGEALGFAKNLDADRYIITPDAQYEGFWYVSEVLTLFWQDINAEYYQSGEFSEHYVFENPSLRPEPDAVYVITSKYGDCFADSDFTVVPFGRFAVAYMR